MGGQNKPRGRVGSSRINDTVSCRNSHFSSSSACRDSFFTRLGLYLPSLYCHSDLVVHFSYELLKLVVDC